MSSFRRPSNASRNPMPGSYDLETATGSGGALELRLEPLERRDALLERRMRREQARDRLLGLRRGDVESGELARGGAKGLLRGMAHRAAGLSPGREPGAGA